MKKVFENLGYYTKEAAGFLIALWAGSVAIGLLWQLSKFAWGL